MDLPYGCFSNRVIGCDNREIQRNACIIAESTQPSAVSVDHKGHGNGHLKPFDICHRSKSTPFYLAESNEFTNPHPIPSICNNSLTSASSSFTSRPLPPLIQVFIRSVNGTTISILIDPSSTIDDLKQVIYSIEGSNPSYQRLKYGC